MVTVSLDAMAAGGIYDQVGGGFHRYSVDAHWLVPHFEKMLYDQALLVRAYLHALAGHRACERYRRIVEETVDVRAARPAPPRRRLLLRRGRRLRGRRGQVLRAGRSTSSRRCAATHAPTSSATSGVTARRQLRGSAHRLPRQHPARGRSAPRTARRRSRASCPRCSRHASSACARASTTRCCSGGTRCSCARSPRPPTRSGATTGWRRRAPTRGSSSASCGATTVGSCVRGRTDGRNLLAYAEDYAALLEALLTLAELDDVAWLGRGARPSPTISCACSPTTSAAGSSPPAPTPRR